MRIYRIILVSVLILSAFFLKPVNSFSQTKEKTKYSRNNNNYDAYNNWGISILYSENGFGVAGMYYKNLSRTSDLFFRLSISGVTDNSEIEYFDIYGNSYVPDKLNRIFNIPASIGFQKYLFYDDIEGNFKPYVNAGVSPSLILMTPYSEGFFPAFKYANVSYSIGGFLGIGLQYFESQHVAMNFDLKYYYLPVLGREVMSLQNKPIKNVGGLQINFGISFLD